MLRPRERIEFGRNGVASVAAPPVFARGPCAPVPVEAQAGPFGEPSGSRLTSFATRIEMQCRRLDLAPDLAENIGSARWLRGVGTLLGLGVFALSFWPDFNAVEAATALPSDRATRDEFRSQMIMPLAMGGESGRHMGATALAVPVANAPERATVQLTATLGAGDSFGRMLQRAGVGAGDAARAAQLVAAQVPLGEVGAGTRFSVTLGKRAAPGEPRPLDRLVFRARFNLDLALARNGGAMTLAARPIPVDATPLRIRGTVGSSLYRSARAAGAPVAAIQQYLQTLDGHLSLEGDITPSDQFDFVVAYKRAASGEAEVGQLLFAGLERKGRPLAQLVRWGGDDQFFEASDAGRPVTSSATLGMPVAGRITSGFGMRFHPVLHYARMHSGVDFGAAWGTPIYAVSDGMVSYAGRHGGHGNYVRLDHGGGLATGYAHMSRFAVAYGTRVQSGQVIGYVGSTGLSTGPHLHYEVYRDGRTVNPLSVKFAMRTAQVDTQQLAAFKSRLAGLKAIQPGAALKKLTPATARPAYKSLSIGG